MLKAADIGALEPFVLERVEVVGAQVRIEARRTEHRVDDDDEQRVADCHASLMLPPTACEAVLLRREIAVRGVGDGPRHLAEDPTQPGIAACCPATEPFAGALAVAWTHSRPGGE